MFSEGFHLSECYRSRLELDLVNIGTVRCGEEYYCSIGGGYGPASNVLSSDRQGDGWVVPRSREGGSRKR